VLLGEKKGLDSRLRGNDKRGVRTTKESAEMTTNVAMDNKPPPHNHNQKIK